MLATADHAYRVSEQISRPHRRSSPWSKAQSEVTLRTISNASRIANALEAQLTRPSTPSRARWQLSSPQAQHEAAVKAAAALAAAAATVKQAASQSSPARRLRPRDDGLGHRGRGRRQRREGGTKRSSVCRTCGRGRLRAVGFDCSGLDMWAWGQAGVNLPHSAAGAVRRHRARFAVRSSARRSRLLRLGRVHLPRDHVHRWRPGHPGDRHRNGDLDHAGLAGRLRSRTTLTAVRCRRLAFDSGAFLGSVRARRCDRRSFGDGRRAPRSFSHATTSSSSRCMPPGSTGRTYSRWPGSTHLRTVSIRTFPGMEFAGRSRRRRAGGRLVPPRATRSWGSYGGAAQGELALVDERTAISMPTGSRGPKPADSRRSFAPRTTRSSPSAGSTKSERVLVSGAAGGVGIAAVQLAIALGASVTATVRSEQRREAVAAFGADAVSPEEGFRSWPVRRHRRARRALRTSDSDLESLAAEAASS